MRNDVKDTMKEKKKHIKAMAKLVMMELSNIHLEVA